MKTKVCPECGKRKRRASFYGNATRRDGLHYYCIPCHNARNKANRQANRERARITERRGHLRRTYGITLEQYDALVAQQNGGCAICDGPPTRYGVFHVDHSHLTGGVRGLLCSRCNQALGLLGDDPLRLRAAIQYLTTEESQ